MKLLSRFIEICLFKAGPQDLPASHWLMKTAVLSYFIVSVLVNRIEYNWEMSLLTSLTDMLMMIFVTILLLKFRKLLNRYQQTITAMAATGSLIGIVGMPLLFSSKGLTEQSEFIGLVMMLLVMVLLWSMMVTAHIFRNALQVKPVTAVMITVAYTIANMMVVGLTMSGVA
jgi:hypothetical protein